VLPLIFGAVAVIALFVPASAHSEEEVRIALAAGRSRVSIEGTKLALFDGEGGVRLAFASAIATLDVRPEEPGVRVDGRGLDRSGAIRAKKLVIEGPDGVRVDGRLYLGRISVEREASGKLIVINRLPIETYLLGIVGSEMSPSWPIESLKAQAVAARTYALQRRMMMRAANRPYDLESTVLSQVYQGAERIRPSVVDAVASTRGEILAFRHQLAEALFHSTCGGQTVSAREAFGTEVPYLAPKKCGFCTGSDRYRWEVSLTLDELGKRLKNAGLGSGKLTALAKRRDGIDLTFGKKKQSVSPKKLRAAVGYTVILSERFDTQAKGQKVIFRGSGFGHGVGMCQWGARGQADRGLGHEEILRHYYSGAEVKRAY
jgi:stage II sporulation protein D